MKLIRLSSTDSNVFRNDIQADLELNEDSQICLLNANFEKKQNILTIGPNDRFKFSYGTPETTTLPLGNATYTKANFEDFITDIQSKLNSSLSVVNPTHVGLGWIVRQTSALKMEIKTDQLSVIDPSTNTKFENVGLTVSGGGVLSKTAGDGAADASLGSNIFSAYDGDNGCGLFRMTINQLSIGGQGVYIGLAEIEPQDMAGDFTFSTAKLKYGIYAENSATNYKCIFNNALSTSTLPPENVALGGGDNDILSIEGNLGNVRGVVYNNANPNGVVLFDEDYTDGEILYPIIGFYDSTDVSVRRVRFTPEDEVNDGVSSKANGLELNLVGSEDLALGTPQPPTQDRNPTPSLIFEFPNKTIATFLGYDNIRTEIPAPPAFRFNLKGQNPLLFTDKSEAYIIELMNLGIDSYDGKKEQRKNILAFIQNTRESTLDDVLFQANNLIFLDLKNKYKQILRNIDVRIVDSNYEDVDIQGEANLTILIKDKGE